MLSRLGGIGLLMLSAAANAAPTDNNASHLPNAAPLQTMQQAHSYSLTNRSSEIIVGAHVRMTNGTERDLTWDQPVRPQQGRMVAVPAADCLATLTVKFQSGRTMQTGAPDCKLSRIIVTNDALQIVSSASDRPPVD